MKISIITAVLNNSAFIEDCIRSVLNQTHRDVEYVVVDGASTDGTLHVVQKYSGRIARWISEPDRGMYDAINKGIAMATGNVVGILNSDDVYSSDTVLERIAAEFETGGVDSVFADLVYVKRMNPDRIVRYYRSRDFHPKMFAYGWMPAHPTFFVKRSCYEKYGLFKTDYAIAADFELLLRFIEVHKISYRYIPEIVVRMRTGGKSTKNLSSNLALNREIIRACGENGIKTNSAKVYLKYFKKVFQFIRKPASV